MGHALQLGGALATLAAVAAGTNLPMPVDSNGNFATWLYLSTSDDVCIAPSGSVLDARPFTECMLVPAGSSILLNVYGAKWLRIICPTGGTAFVGYAASESA